MQENLHILPENDPDLALARQIGALLETGESISSVSDDLVQVLRSFTQHQQKQTEFLHIDSADLWAKIDAQTPVPVPKQVEEVAPKPTARVTFLRRNAWMWSAAAVLLLAVFLSLFMWPASETSIQFVAGNDTKTVTLADGSVIELRAHSSVDISETSGKIVVKLSGESRFDVAKNPTRVFSVQTSDGQINVTGTAFYVSALKNGTRVFLENGSVSVKNTFGEVHLVPGESAIIDSGNPPTKAELSKTSVSDWQRGELSFENEPVENVLHELELHFGIAISWPDNLKNERISGVVALTDLQHVLQNVGLVLGGRFVEQHGSYQFLAD